VFGDTDTMKTVSVLEGDSVTLNSSLTKIQTDDKIAWMSGNKRSCIARINRETKKVLNVSDVSFRDRLKLDNQTGSLTITNTRTTDSGLYEVSVSNSITETKHGFNVTVYARLPVPAIGNSSNSLSPSVSKCSFLCSALNVSRVTLSWYKGNSLLSIISVSDLSISLSLPLELDCLDDSYSCVVAYSFTNQTTHLTNTQLCPTCSVKGSVTLIALISAAGSLLIVAAAGLFRICRKHREADQEVQTRAEEITYTDPVFKRNVQRARVKQENDAVYASVIHKR
ncbi:hypothetical protein QQF64_019946, partial [Cirrhinus molitorella]